MDRRDRRTVRSRPVLTDARFQGFLAFREATETIEVSLRHLGDLRCTRHGPCPRLIPCLGHKPAKRRGAPSHRFTARSCPKSRRLFGQNGIHRPERRPLLPLEQGARRRRYFSVSITLMKRLGLAAGGLMKPAAFSRIILSSTVLDSLPPTVRTYLPEPSTPSSTTIAECDL